MKTIEITVYTAAAQTMTTEQILEQDKASIVSQLLAFRRQLVEWGIAESDIRLQMRGENWSLHYGDASYDQDHRGFWGAGSVQTTYDLADLEAVAQDLIEQVLEQEAMEG